MACRCLLSLLKMSCGQGLLNLQLLPRAHDWVKRVISYVVQYAHQRNAQSTLHFITSQSVTTPPWTYVGSVQPCYKYYTKNNHSPVTTTVEDLFVKSDVHTTTSTHTVRPIGQAVTAWVITPVNGSMYMSA